jgi:chorismate mutase
MQRMADAGKVVALRGATQSEENTSEAIIAATAKLMRELMTMNELEPEQMISAIFTTTEDLDAEFPAVAARQIGLNEVPLMCAREIPVPGAMPRVIRVMVHSNLPADQPVRHVYLGETRALRADLNAAQ